MDFRDTQIAGIALSRRATLLATRNAGHFHDLRVPAVDRWQGALVGYASSQKFDNYYRKSDAV